MTINASIGIFQYLQLFCDNQWLPYSDQSSQKHQHVVLVDEPEMINNMHLYNLK